MESFFRNLIATLALSCALAMPAALATGPTHCEELLDPPARARAIVRELDASLPGESKTAELSVSRLGADGKPIAWLVYVMTDPGVMNVARVEVLPDFRKRGFNRLLQAQALLTRPETRRIEATLAWSNAEAFFTAFRAQSWREKLFHGVRAERRAFEATPFYKTCAALGFTRVTRVDVRDENVDVELEREL